MEPVATSLNLTLSTPLALSLLCASMDRTVLLPKMYLA